MIKKILRAPTGGLWLMTAAAFVIVVAGMRAASPILVPFLLSVFITIVISSPFAWLRRHHLPSTMSLTLVTLGLLLVVLLLGILIGNSVDDFSRSYPVHQEQLRSSTRTLLSWLDEQGLPLSQQVIFDYLDPGKAMALAADMLQRMGAALTNGFLILLTVIFLLLEASDFPTKWQMARADGAETMEHFYQMVRDINRYMGIKTLTSLVTGVLIALWLTVLGVDYASLWGLVAFLLNFVPNIGSVLAAVPAVLLALIQLGPGAALLAASGYLGVNIVIGSVAEPKIMGHGLGLSTLVVFLSLVFWGWVLGPVGMLLSVPLTIASKIALNANPDTRWIAVMLGPSQPPPAAPSRRDPS